jgi:hypothetical protein
VEGGFRIALSPARSLAGAAALLALAASTVGVGGHTADADAASGCGARGRALLGALGDGGAQQVKLAAQTTSIAALGARRRPGKLSSRRRDGFERQAWRVVAQITEYRLAPNGAIRLILFDGGAYMRAELPPLACLTARTPARRTIAATRTRFVTACGKATPQWRPLGAVGYVTGVGFWGSRTVRQAAPNGAELHPVISLRLIVGCR